MNLLLLAVAPAMVIMIYIYFKDKIEKEPIKFVLRNFIMGATISIVITGLLSTVLNKFFPLTNPKDVFQQFIKAFIVVALVEEFAKYVIVRFVAQPSEKFNEPFDGIVYAVAVSMGFATLENILYTFQYGAKTGLVRAFTAVPAHAIFAVLMGYYIGKAKFSNNKHKLNIFGLSLAVLFHGLYDFFLFINFIPGVSFGAVISLVIGVFLTRRIIKSYY